MRKLVQIATASFFLLFGAFGVFAQSVPSLINYQGRLTDQTGAPLSGGQYTVQFRLWNSPTAFGTNDLIWDQQQNVTVQTNGVFNLILGSAGGSAIAGTTPAVNNLAYAFASSNCFLGVTVAVSNGVTLTSTSEILPRQQLLSVPYAIQAQQAQVASSLVTNLENALSPPGTVVAYMGTNSPPGWLLCDGTPVSRSQYSSLFAAIGTCSGAGDGVTTFNLPDFRGLFLRGVNGNRNDSFNDPDTLTRTNIYAGGNTGNSVGSYEGDQLKAHTHGFNMAVGRSGCNWACAGSNSNPYENSSTDPANLSINSTGGNETRPKNAFVNYIIKY